MNWNCPHKNNFKAYTIIRFYCLISRLVCCYKNLFSILLQFKSKHKSNLASILKYKWLLSTLTPCDRSVKCGSESMNIRLFPHILSKSIFYGPRNQLQPGSSLLRREEPGKEVVIWYVQCMHGYVHAVDLVHLFC